MNVRLLILAVLLMLNLFFPAYATTFKVPSAKYPMIQSGIDAAQSGDTVLVGDGTYRGDGNRDLDFKGKSLTVKSVHGAAKTIIDCQGSAAKPHRGFFIHQSELAVTIEGFTVEHGDTASDAVPQSVTHWGSRLGGGGGGIYINTKSSAVIKNCVCRDNIANADYGGGGGVYINSGDVVVTSCTFSGNTVNSGTVTGAEAAFMGITHGGRGGGVFVENSGGVAIRNCTFSSNTANGGDSTTNGGFGGGAFVDSPDGVGGATVTDCTFSGNTASGHNATGGGLLIGSSNRGGLSVMNCIFRGNTANGTTQSGRGGGAFITSDKGTVVTSCTFSGNTTNSITLANDTSGALYGGYGCAACIYIRNGTTVTNRIAWGNKSTSKSALASEFYCPSGDGRDPSPSPPAAFTCNDIEGGTPWWANKDNLGTGNLFGESNINQDPLFVNAAAGDLHLKPGSPCLGAGTPTGAPTTDKDGKKRPNPPSMGAYEQALPSLPLTRH